METRDRQRRDYDKSLSEFENIALDKISRTILNQDPQDPENPVIPTDDFFARFWIIHTILAVSFLGIIRIIELFLFH